ncbi:MAG TPA: FAD-dependent oxidoreductase [Myxococcales bacterium]|nr:FAD-dependent oxidoreductase [Myxococcales bacterium]
MAAIVIGGGFFGCSLALALRERGQRVTVIERERDLLLRASTNNQARIHGGYHYPRSILTGLRSRVNYPRFAADFSRCIDRSFRHYYAVARRQSQVTARQFEEFCGRIGARLSPAPREVRALFDQNLIERVYEVEEHAFDAHVLRATVRERLQAAQVDVQLGTRALRVVPGGLRTDRGLFRAEWTFNCTYSSLNQLLAASSVPCIPLRHELAEVALVEPPPSLRGTAVTVMCGPFFSMMPFPPSRLSSLTHVRYTPHCAWEERSEPVEPPALTPPSRAAHMLKDAQRYVPAMAMARYARSFFEVKTILPQSERDDSRPILFRPSPELPGLVSVIGGKIDNVYDLPRELDELFQEGRAA